MLLYSLHLKVLPSQTEKPCNTVYTKIIAIEHWIIKKLIFPHLFISSSLFIIIIIVTSVTTYLSFRRFATDCDSSNIAIFTHRIYFSADFLVFICLKFIVTYIVTHKPTIISKVRNRLTTIVKDTRRFEFQKSGPVLLTIIWTRLGSFSATSLRIVWDFLSWKFQGGEINNNQTSIFIIFFQQIWN